MKEKLKNTEIWFKLALFALIAYLCFVAFSYPKQSKQYPLLIAISTLIILVISLVMDFAGKGKAIVTEIASTDAMELKMVDETVRKLRRKRFYQAWAIILVSTGVGFLGGFLFSTFSMFFGFALVFGKKQNLLKNTMIAVGVTVLTYLIFDWLMLVPLLEGILWDFF
jgi:hypothetical protein